MTIKYRSPGRRAERKLDDARAVFIVRGNATNRAIRRSAAAIERKKVSRLRQSKAAEYGIVANETARSLAKTYGPFRYHRLLRRGEIA